MLITYSLMVCSLYTDAIVEYKQGFIPDWLGIWHLVTMPMQGTVSFIRTNCTRPTSISIHLTMNHRLLRRRRHDDYVKR